MKETCREGGGDNIRVRLGRERRWGYMNCICRLLGEMPKARMYNQGHGEVGAMLCEWFNWRVYASLRECGLC